MLHRLLPGLLALVLLAPAPAAQGFWAGPEDDWTMTDGPPVLAGSTMEETASEIGQALRDQSDDSFMNMLIWWMATNLSGHIPVDPNCPPPNGCPPAGGGEDPPSGGTPPAGGEPPTEGGGGGETPPGGSPPAGGGDPPEETEPEALSSASADGYATFRIGDRAQALAVRTRFDRVVEGAFVPDAALPNGARLRLVSKREADRRDRSEFQLRLEVVPRGARASATPVLVQAGAGQLIARLANTEARPRGGRRAAGDAAPAGRRARGRR